MIINYIRKPASRIFPAIIVLTLGLCSCDRTKNPEVTTDELLSHIKYLSSDSLQGRMTGSAGDSLAAEYIKNELASYGMVPLSGDGLQRFEVTKRVLPGKANSLSINGISYTPDKNFMPLAFSSNEKKLNETRKPFGFSTRVTVNANSEIVRENSNTRNVVMILPGEDEQLKNEYIIIGAHFDHLGMGGPGSPSRAADTTGIHPGANDNASGIAMMLELAEKFASTKGSHKRSIICIAFTGEEEGLLGSKHFTNNPGIDISKVNAMINLDMVGRLTESNNLQIFGAGTATGLKDLIYSKSDTTVIKLTLSDEGYEASDHSSFYLKNIPVLFYFTGVPFDYHTPSDTYDKINYNGMVKISDLIFSVAEELASTTDRLQFIKSVKGERLKVKGERQISIF